MTGKLLFTEVKNELLMLLKVEYSQQKQRKERTLNISSSTKASNISNSTCTGRNRKFFKIH